VKRTSRPGRAALTLLGLLLAGCLGATDNRLPTHPVSGQLFVNNKPAADAVVQLYGEGAELKGLCPHGIVGADGTFRLTTYRTGDGAPAGAYALTVTWPGPPQPGRDEGGPDQFRGRYADPRRPVRQVTVGPGINEIERIDLK
jgi:hypothetical protein